MDMIPKNARQEVLLSCQLQNFDKIKKFITENDQYVSDYRFSIVPKADNLVDGIKTWYLLMGPILGMYSENILPDRKNIITSLIVTDDEYSVLVDYEKLPPIKIIKESDIMKFVEGHHLKTETKGGQKRAENRLSIA